MKKIICLLLVFGLICPMVQAATEIRRFEQILMVRSADYSSVSFRIYGVCDLLIETNSQGVEVSVAFHYVGGVFANYNHGGASGRADEIITSTQSFVRETEPTVAVWIYDYDLSRYGSGVTGKGSGSGICDLRDLFPNL